MITTNTPNMSPVDALWTLYKTQTKAVQKAFLALVTADREEKRKTDRVQKDSTCLMAVAQKARQEYKDGKGVTLNSPEEIEAYLDSL